jgi:hypothetical protein
MTARFSGKLKDEDERAFLLNPFISLSTADAAARGLSLTVVRPTQSHFFFRKKPREVIEVEREYCHGEAASLRTYNEKYPSKGMVFAMGTVKARPRQWLLLGVIRLNELTENQKRQINFAF